MGVVYRDNLSTGRTPEYKTFFIHKTNWSLNDGVPGLPRSLE